MLKLFFKLFKASFSSNKLFSLLNILGLSIGICSSLLIYLWVTHELSYDKFHNNSKNIYRLIAVESHSNGQITNSLTDAPLVGDLKNDYPQIVKSTSLLLGDSKSEISYKEKRTKLNLAYTSNDFFDLFSFPILHKSGQDLFTNDFSAVISGACAKKIFGDENPIGKQIEHNFFKRNKIYEISAVVEIPQNSHLSFEILVPYTSDISTNRNLKYYNAIKTINYIQTGGNSRFTNTQLDELYNYLDTKANNKTKLIFQSLHDIHLFTKFDDAASENNGNIRYVRAFSTAALFILIIAALNYIILTIARAEKRNKEIGLKKLFGTNRLLLTMEFLAEVLIFTFIAQLIAIVIFLLLKPYFNALTSNSLDLQFNLTSILYFILSALIISILAGAYLSFYLSSLKPLNLLKGISKRGTKYHLTNFITPFQLIISFIFIICAITLYKQVIFMKNKDTGVNLENIIGVNTYGFAYEYESIKNELLNNANIYSVTMSGSPPINYTFEKSGISWEGKENEDPVSFNIMCVDYSYLDIFGLELIQGSMMPNNMTVKGHFDGRYSYKTPIIINETALSLLGYNEPIGKKLNLGHSQMSGYITGVVRDFHFKPLQHKASPLALGYDPESFKEMYIKINSKKTTETLKYIEKTINTYRIYGHAFDYYFLKEKSEQLYTTETNTSKFAFLFSVISISLSLLGIIGMVTFSVARQKKSITIRKVYGAEPKDIILMHIRELIITTSGAFILAAIVSWYYLSNWLENYAYHIKLSPFLFITIFLTVLLVLIIITISLVYSEANKNPIENLSYE